MSNLKPRSLPAESRQTLLHPVADGGSMWEQYHKTFRVMQTLIAVATLTIFIWSRVWQVAAIFFVTMQASSVVGGLWAHRLHVKLRPLRLPLSEH